MADIDEWEAAPEPTVWLNDPEFYAAHREVDPDHPEDRGWTCGECGQTDNQEATCEMCGETWGEP